MFMIKLKQIKLSFAILETLASKNNINKKGLRQCAKLQDLGEDDCYFYGGKTRSNPTL